MITYQVTITADRYPKVFEVKASGWRSAIGKAVGRWYKEKRHASYSDTMRIIAIKQQALSTQQENEV